MSNASQASPIRGDVNTEPAAAASNPGNHLNASQIDAIQKRMIAEFSKAIDEVEFRKQAIELAVQCAKNDPGLDVLALAQAIFEFMVAPSREITIKVV